MARSRTQSSSRSPDEAPQPRQRLDLWLWHARIARARSLAAGLAASGHVRINGQRVRAAGKSVKIGDVLTIALDRRVLVLRVEAFAGRRGAYAEARLLYADLNAGSGAATDA